MNDELAIRCGPPDRSGRQLVVATYGQADCRATFEVQDATARCKFRERVIERFAFSDAAHEWLEREIVAAAKRPALQTRGPILVRLADVEARPIDWLWPQRLALGRLSLLVGRPGCGKSFVTCDMASRVSTGTPWPDGSACPRGSVLLLASEDDAGDTIRPRLDAHKADVSRVHMLQGVQRIDDAGEAAESMFTLADLASLEQALLRCEDCRLLVIDPIGSYLGGKVDAHRDNEVRSVLAPVGQLAEKHNVAVLVICHTRKGASASADDTAMGSRAFTGIARSVWHLSRDSDDNNRRLLLPGKSNIAAEQSGLAFTIGGEPASVRWEQDPVAMTADEALARANSPRGETTALEEAVRWLEEHLEAGPVPAKQLKEAAKADGLSVRTLERGKAKLGVVACPDGFGGPWVWKLPETGLDASFPTVRQPSAESAKQKTLADTGETVANSDGSNGRATA